MQENYTEFAQNIENGESKTTIRPAAHVPFERPCRIVS
jgi:hypothetical protein